MYFVEYLTLRTWLLVVLPRLLLHRIRGHGRPTRCYVFESSRLAMRCARATAPLTGVPVERLRYRLVDVRDERGLLLRLRIAYQDLAQAQADAMQHPIFKAAVSGAWAQDRLPSYLAKAMATISFSERGRLWRALLTVQVCAWKSREERKAGMAPVLFLEQLPWFEAIARYAARSGILTIAAPAVFNPKRWVRRCMTPEMLAWVRYLKARWSCRTLGVAPKRKPMARARVAVEYYGHLNLNQPERYSDLFFWQQSSIAGSDVLVTFAHPEDPVDERKHAELAEHGIQAVALHPRATRVPAIPVFLHRPRRHRSDHALSQSQPHSRELAWLKEQVREYRALRAYWEECFATHDVKIYLSWFKYNAAHCAIADALRDVGGLMALYQRAYEELPSAETTIDVDLVFGFSQAAVDLERRSGSRILYHVTTGYLGDHRFPLLRQESARVRQSLQRHGARRILAFTDENSRDDPRWHSGHEFQRENYAFLLEKVLDEPWLGLVVKPKRPGSLRQRLGSVAELLTRAEATGRCFVYEGGALHGAYAPAAAALASDLMIHGHLCAGTAGVEAVLAGVPTLLMDREGWSASPLYRLGVGRVVFTDWAALWKGCVEHWAQPGGVAGFGDWAPLLDELDPFRDGRAAERMGAYVQWLLEGFHAGVARETVMADAAQRYAALWGHEKVTQINADSALPSRDASWIPAVVIP